MSIVSPTALTEQGDKRYEPYRVSVQEYVTFHEQGFLVVRGLVPLEDVQALVEHMDDLLNGKELIPGYPAPSPDLTADQKVQYWLRIHMLHRKMPIHERFMLHPRVLDVLEALIGPDVLALQTMLFFKQPGQPGQGYHQDSYYIPTLPDTLCGAWLAVDRADEENGCMWMTTGSQNEPVYPDSDGVSPNGQRNLGDIQPIAKASHTDERQNGLTRVAHKYTGREVKAEVDPGDVIFFGGHIIHRSHTNNAKDRMRRSFVGHYCNARSWVPWNHGTTFDGDAANYMHILARGDTHLPFAQPIFGTPCAATLSAEVRKQQRASTKAMSMMGDDSGMMAIMPHPEKAPEDGND